MKWESNRQKKIDKKKNWHDFFCLLPRRIIVNDDLTLWVWLETVERKGRPCYDFDYWLYAYRIKNS